MSAFWEVEEHTATTGSGRQRQFAVQFPANFGIRQLPTRLSRSMFPDSRRSEADKRTVPLLAGPGCSFEAQRISAAVQAAQRAALSSTLTIVTLL
jgi:hypothetical protein